MSLNSFDYYEFLGLTIDATDREITRAYRKKAIIYHPDKNKSESAKTIFQDLAKAYEILSDPKARAAYDVVKKVKLEKKKRELQLSEKRRNLKENLEKREKEAEKNKNKKKYREDDESFDSDITEAQQYFYKEVERLRQEGNTRLQQELERMKARLSFYDFPMKNQSYKRPEEYCKVKLKWKIKEKKFTAHELKSYLESKYGLVKHVVVSMRSTGTAVVEFEDFSSAQHAVSDSQESIRVAWIIEPPSLDTFLQCEKRSELLTNSGSTRFEQFEAMTLLKMRQSQDLRNIALLKKKGAQGKPRLLARVSSGHAFKAKRGKRAAY
jgi:DnaJ family protein C protein 17